MYIYFEWFELAVEIHYTHFK